MSSSKRWLHEHFNDFYVRQAKEQGYPSRAAYKLLELNKKDHFLKKGMNVVDLGAAPGGWSMVTKQIVGPTGQVFAIDCLPMEPISGVEFIQGDFTESDTLQLILDKLKNIPIHLVISDMAPNMTGCKTVDQSRVMYLAELALDLAKDILAPNGCLLIKLFQGSGVDSFVLLLRHYFRRVLIRKPNASRSRSAEIYIVACDFVASSL
jgi:23S rRNA (uridine2552-2'-O)-methyltransferase